ncbi:hypothetical protein A4X06_0g5874 [Tilletia controversa]|uniref:Peptidase A2 domain-containing protein n=1 Tax=Tilletia controversa TaxID=13291 RepID=A0A8X7MQJ6_9BASI|nr:hypothetical protein A4X06_0g5874 [Tilletia controversa]
MNPVLVQTAMAMARLRDGLERKGFEADVVLQTEGPSSALFFNDRAEFHAARSWEIRGEDRPLDRSTRRRGRVVTLPSSVATGSGLGYRRHDPLFTKLRLNDVDGPAVSSLVDTSASLSSIDAALLEKLGGRPQGKPIPVHGIGHTESLGFTTITFFLDAHDDHGLPLHLEIRQDFHVLPSFSPGMILGLDFITSHQVSLDPSRGKAMLGAYTVPVRESLRAPHATEAELCLTAAVVLQPRCHQWVPVDVGALTPEVDYIVHPRWSAPSGEEAMVAGPAAVFNAAGKHILLTNLSDRPVALERRTAVADAVAAHLGDICSSAGHAFALAAWSRSARPTRLLLCC